MPDKSSIWAVEGTHGHEVLEAVERITLSRNDPKVVAEYMPVIRAAPKEMVQYAKQAASFIFKKADEHPGSEVLVEQKVYLDFIHKDMFGTFDGAVVAHFDTLHVFDYKYGAGHFVRPDCLQMIFYGIGVAHRYDWNFKRVRLWIIQPRVAGYDGPLFYEEPILQFRRHVDVFKRAVENVEKNPNLFVEGAWCWWCKAKSKCPKKLETKALAGKSLFTLMPYRP